MVRAFNWVQLVEKEDVFIFGLKEVIDAVWNTYANRCKEKKKAGELDYFEELRNSYSKYDEST
jgi:hypothetical protein